MFSQNSKLKDHWLQPVTGNVYRFNQQTLYGETVGIYLIDTTNQMVIIDGPSGQDELIEALKKISKPITIVLTHGPSFNKSDHLVRALGATVLLHELDSTNKWLGKNSAYCTFWKENTYEVTPGITLYHSGGHSKGHCLIHHTNGSGILFTGDEIYADDKGVVQLEEELRVEPLHSQYLKRLSKIITGLTFEQALPLHENGFSNARERIITKFFK